MPSAPALGLIGLDWNWLVWLVGIVVAISVVIITFYFRFQKDVIIAATAIAGAGVIVGALLFSVTGVALAITSTTQKTSVRSTTES